MGTSNWFSDWNFFHRLGISLTYNWLLMGKLRSLWVMRGNRCCNNIWKRPGKCGLNIDKESDKFAIWCTWLNVVWQPKFHVVSLWFSIHIRGTIPLIVLIDYNINCTSTALKWLQLPVDLLIGFFFVLRSLPMIYTSVDFPPIKGITLQFVHLFLRHYFNWNFFDVIDSSIFASCHCITFTPETRLRKGRRNSVNNYFVECLQPSRVFNSIDQLL